MNQAMSDSKLTKHVVSKLFFISVLFDLCFKLNFENSSKKEFNNEFKPQKLTFKQSIEQVF